MMMIIIINIIFVIIITVFCTFIKAWAGWSF